MLYSFRLVGMREIHRWPVDDPHKGLVMHTIDVFFVGYTEAVEQTVNLSVIWDASTHTRHCCIYRQIKNHMRVHNVIIIKL